MSQPEVGADPIRRRAGLLSSLVKLYASAKTLIESDGPAEEAQQLIDKLHERYTAYLESHEIALAAYPQREDTLLASHFKNEERHQQLLSNLQAYVDGGTKPFDLQSLHAASLFSHRSSAKKSVAKSCPPLRKADTASRVSQNRSVMALSETRVQVALAKRRYEQQQAEQLAAQRKIEFDREVARQHRELDMRQKEAEMRQRQLQEEADARERQRLEDAAARERQRQEEAAARERQRQEDAAALERSDRKKLLP